MYSSFYRTPRLYLSGYGASGEPLAPKYMMDDIVGDYTDKTVTIEDFPFFSNNVKMASVHPCKHASVMKTLLDRADGALRTRREKQRAKAAAASESSDAHDRDAARLTSDMARLDIRSDMASAGARKPSDEWEEVHQTDVDDEDEVAIRVDQYLVVFLKVRLYHPFYNFLPRIQFPLYFLRFLFSPWPFLRVQAFFFY